ncbi:dihydrofolate reductase family protein [Fulvivirgaceae bacterium PWU4]|uniref:Dihydrofolate reductase family protein n=1 Tax=Chryseosolibacter histidini TaxID=2782349 RepID=A0AAP2DMW7_9BACT|nr:dihydrofolate reductase family protein [Chryseosolibacter histidini]MBT1698158.1 dihydrofolate reductase family protein [Chryseosolibacter histidini]
MKVIAAMNMTLDGFCDHTYGNATPELHQHYADMLRGAGAALYGRTTYQLMEFWPTVLKNPTGNKEMDDFAVAMDNVPKVVFSRTLKNLDWHSARLATKSLEEEVSNLKRQATKDIYACSPSLIVQLTELKMIDEYQLCVHPVIAGSGLPLFKNITDQVALKYLKTKPFESGALVQYYERITN